MVLQRTFMFYNMSEVRMLWNEQEYSNCHLLHYSFKAAFASNY